MKSDVGGPFSLTNHVITLIISAFHLPLDANGITNDSSQEADEVDERSYGKFDPYSDCYSSISIDTLDRSEIDSAFGSVDNKSNGTASNENRDNTIISKRDGFVKKMKLLRKGSNSFERVSVSSNSSFNVSIR